MNTENEYIEKFIKEVKEASANVKMDNLPLSDEFILMYIKSELEKLKSKEKRLVRGKNNYEL